MPGHSAFVTITLTTSSGQYDAAQSGPDFVILREDAFISEGPARLDVQVDDHHFSSDLMITKAVSGRRVDFSGLERETEKNHRSLKVAE
ncbi:MAG: hypothetical protein P1U81_14405 [Verrucomicrobiales bacterium]|jgi:hypothetical protein|nr:hypothetical protein [Verrucomicrobiales bacterium]